MRAPGETILSKERLEVIRDNLVRCLPLGGEVWECGVYAGGSAMVIAQIMACEKALRGTVIPLRLFDTFAGIALSTDGLDFHKNGEFGDIDDVAVTEMLREFPFVSIHKGIFPFTFESLVGSEICFAHIDCDVYLSVKGCIDFIWPRLKEDGVMIFDDYFHENCRGAKKAVDEFFSRDGGPVDWSSTEGAFPQLVITKLC